MKHLLLALHLAFALCACSQPVANNLQPIETGISNTFAEADNTEITQAFTARKSDVQVSGHGIIVKLLKDDLKGSMHQRFLVRINAQQTLLFAHNLDLAPRVPVQTGDQISFYGEYVYNPKGGIIHWTHHAPQNDHAAGWILHQGKKYQ